MKEDIEVIDAVALMREIRDRMSAEIKGMSYEQEKEYLRAGSECKQAVPGKHRREAV